MSDEKILDVRDLVKHFGAVRAADGISFSIQRGETLGLVGESGCGKSTVGRAILQLQPPNSGAVHFQGQDLVQLSRSSIRKTRRHIQMVFQDPFASLNPKMTIGRIVGEPLEVHGLRPRADRPHRVRELLDLVGLKPSSAERYPHEFSGGQRQRIGIARALAAEPDLIVCDEPVSALDVSIQAQIVNLLEGVQKQLGLSYLFISHDLSVVRHISRRVAVMYLGRIIETAPSDALYEHPLHPYTQALLSAVPIPDPRIERRRQRIVLQGDLPNPAHPPSGCRFRTRCPHAMAICSTAAPKLTDRGGGHQVECHLYT